MLYFFIVKGERGKGDVRSGKRKNKKPFYHSSSEGFF